MERSVGWSQKGSRPQIGPRGRACRAPDFCTVTETDRASDRFAAYLDEHDYSWKHEPDYQGRTRDWVIPLATKPDFLVEREDQRAVAEVRQFESSVLQNQLSGMGRGGRWWHPGEGLRPAAVRAVGEGRAAATAGRRRRAAAHRAGQRAGLDRAPFPGEAGFRNVTVQWTAAQAANFKPLTPAYKLVAIYESLVHRLGAARLAALPHCAADR